MTGKIVWEFPWESILRGWYYIGVEIWGGDERRRFQCIESGNSLNGRNLFIECLSRRNPYQSLHSLNMPSSHSVKRHFSSLISASSHPLPQTLLQNKEFRPFFLDAA